MVNDLPDIQETKPKIEIPIKQVGVENVEVPFSLQSRNPEDGFYNNLIANVSMRTNIAHNIKGVSMSRFIGTLKKYLGKPLKHKLIHDILLDMKESMGTTEAYMKFNFKLPKTRRSPVSPNAFPIYYNCSFEGQIINVIDSDVISYNEISPDKVKEKFRFYQGVTVQYASYCPCSSGLCNHLKENGSIGFPHAQRSFAKVIIETREPNYIWLEDIIDTVESSIATLPYPIIKRADEQRIAEIAAENPIFVEDAIRQISEALDRSAYYDWFVKCIHEESIHTSEAIASNWKGINGGFDYTFAI